MEYSTSKTFLSTSGYSVWVVDFHSTQSNEPAKRTKHLMSVRCFLFNAYNFDLLYALSQFTPNFTQIG